MEVIVAKNSGFCFGVKRAVDMVYSQIGHGNIYTFGPVIHNEEVIKDLENNGVKVINSVEEAADVPKGTVIIRHTVFRSIYTEKFYHLAIKWWMPHALLYLRYIT